MGLQTLGTIARRADRGVTHAQVTVGFNATASSMPVVVVRAGDAGDRQPFGDQVPTTGISTFEPVSHVLGQLASVLDRYDEADAHFARAAAFNDRAGAKFFAANTNLAWARMLLERDAPGDDERARDLLTAAHTGAAAHGYSGIERHVAEALKHLDRP